MNSPWVIKHFSLLTGSSQYDTFCSMSKKRKTRKEKIISQERKDHLITQRSSDTTIYSYTSAHTSLPSQKQQTYSAGYSYVATDMKKSLFITSLILIASITLFILLQANIIRFSSLGY